MHSNDYVIINLSRSHSGSAAVQGEPANVVVPSRPDLIQCPLATRGQSEGATADPHPEEQHPDDAAVDRFCAAMKAKLYKKREEGRGGWQSMTAEQLSALLHEHVRKGDPVDVSNFAMMLHQNGQRIEQQSAPDIAGLVEALTGAVEYLDSNTGHGLWRDTVILQIEEALAAHRNQGD